MTHLSFIIPCYEGFGTISKTLDSILATPEKLNFEIIVVDNNSHNLNEKNLILKNYPNIIFINCPIQGPAATRNYGSQKARGDILIFVDDDVIVPIGWAAELESIYSDYPWVDIVAGSVIPARLTNNLLYRLRYFLISSKTQGTFNYLSLPPAASLPIVNTSLCSIKKKKFIFLGGFDQELLSHEDAYFSFLAVYSSLHIKSHSLAGLVYFHKDKLINYFKRSHNLGKWFPVILKKSGKEKSSIPWTLVKPDFKSLGKILELMRLVNNIFFIIGFIKGLSFRKKFEKKELIQTPNPRNSIMFHFELNGVSYQLNSYLSLIHHELGLNLFSGDVSFNFDKNSEKIFLKTFGGKGKFNTTEKLILSTWVNSKIFIHY